MEDPGCGLPDTAMEPPESASLQAAMEFPVTASFGPMGPLLRQLRSLPKGVDDDKIQLLKDNIGGLCISLVDVSEAKDAGFAAKWWIKEVRELCYDTEDYLGEVMKQQQSRAGARRSARLSTIFRVGRKLEWRPQAQIGKRAQGRSSASRLQEICTKRRNRKPQPPKIVTSFLELMARAEVLDDVIERFNLGHKAIKPDCARDGVSRLTLRLPHQLPVLSTPISVHRDAGGSRLVDVEEPVNKLANLLAFDDGNQKQLKVVCILGFPGVGKTAVATTLYHNFRGKFQCRAFVRVTRSPDMIMILTSILKQTKAPQVCSFPDAQDLIDNIREHLQDKRYFIVIDDLSTISAWNIISRAFPDDNCCSRIVITTGTEDISLACCGYHLTNIFEMSPLSNVQSRGLFFGRVFGSEDGCSPNFREVLYGIIRKCGGSPLAIVCAASLLAWEPDLGFENWECIQDSLSSIVDSLSSIVSTYSTSEGMKEVLNLIYNDLPPDMKTCLLHLAIYPEGYTIRKDDLVKQWVAEGFLNTIEGQDTEKIAGAYFDELVSRGIVQAADTNYNGELLFCTVHQMVLDFIRDKSIEENFAITVDCFQSVLPLPDKVRRLSVQFGGAKSAKIPGGIIVSQARSLLFCGFFKCVPSITDYGLLRVLILHIWSDEDKTFDLTRIRELFHLTYLNIECNITIKLPANIRGLQYLGTLEVDARLSAVPSDIVHLKKLLHLRVPSESNLPHGVGRLASLRTLGYFDISGNSVDNVMDLGKLTNLQDLQLTCSTLQPVENLEKNMQLLGSVLEKLRILQSITLIHTPHSNVTASSMSISCDSLSCVSHAPVLLEKIELLPQIFIFPSLPKWFEQLDRLRVLKIAVRELWEEGIDILKALPGLTALTLYVQTAPSERIVFDKEGFFVLKYFNFRCSEPRLKFEAGAMPNLLKLKLSFNAARVEQQDTPAISIERLSSLEEISTKIGGADADAESALTATITNHASNPRIIVQLVDWFFHGDASTLTKEKQQIIKDKDQVKEKEKTNDSRAQHTNQNNIQAIAMDLATGAMGSLLPKLVQLLNDEYKLQTGVKEDVKSIEKEMKSMHAALRKVAEVRRDQLDMQVKLWAGEVRELSFDMEDIVDKFLVRVDDDSDTATKSNKLKRLTEKMASLFTKWKARHEIADAIKDINMQVQEVAKRRERYNVDNIVAMPAAMTTIDPRIGDLYKEVTDLVGIAGERDRELMRLLFDGDSVSEQKLKIVSVVGFGGLGKTTLVKTIYDKIKGDFDCSAFVPIGQNADAKKILMDILIDLGKFKSQFAMFDTRQLIDILRESLENKRYLIVIDDIWEEKPWRVISLALSRSKKIGSRLITTTRIVSLSKLCCSSPNDSVYEMKCLSDDDSKRLFYKRIFSNESGCPREFEEVSRDILKKCGGVPLAIITMARLLASQYQQVKAVDEWHALLESIGRGVEDPSVEEMVRILSFSYYDLPSHLKTCLLYLSMFPKDYKITKDRLIWMWIAENFVQCEKRAKTSLFEIGETYFYELLNRNVILPVYDSFDGRVVGCSVHGMVQDLILSLSSEENFVTVVNGTGDSMSSQSNIRRLSLHDARKGTPLETPSLFKVRSVASFGDGIDIMPSFSRFVVLRVLDLTGCPLGDHNHLNLQELGSILQLRYLCLASTGVSEIPEEFGKLQFLQVLDLKENDDVELPSSIIKLRRLMCLLIDSDHKRLPDGLRNLASMEVLKEIYCDSVSIAKDLGNMECLRELRIMFDELSLELQKAFVESLGKLSTIQILVISNIDEEVKQSTDVLWERLMLSRSLQIFTCRHLLFPTLPAWIRKDSLHMSQLFDLQISVKGARQEDLDILGRLPALRSLILEIHRWSGLLLVGPDVFRCLVSFELPSSSPGRILFQPGAMPKVEKVELCVGLRGAIDEEAACEGMGNLLSLRRANVDLYNFGVADDLARRAVTALEKSSRAHPNHPHISAYVFPGYQEDALDDDVCSEAEEDEKITQYR